MIDNFYESTLEKIIIKNKSEISKNGFPSLYKNVENQYVLSNGRRIDIFSWEVFDNIFYCKIFELKRGDITVESLNQISEYNSTFLMSLYCNGFDDVRVDLYLIGSGIRDEVFDFAKSYENIHFFTYEFEMNGLFFKKAKRSVFYKKSSEFSELDLAKWLLDHPFINKSALCKAAKLDRGNFDKYLKMGKFPEAAEKSLSEQLKAYGYGK